MSDVVVTINGQKFSVNATVPLSFRDVADAAGFKHPALPSMTLQQKGVEGRIVHPGGSVMPVDGMVFNVADTSNA
jgi:hypothetical protein